MFAAPPLQAEAPISAWNAPFSGGRSLWLWTVAALFLAAGVAVAETQPPPADEPSPLAEEADLLELKVKLDAQLERMAERLTARLNAEVDRVAAKVPFQIAARLAERHDPGLARRTNAGDRLDAQLAARNTRLHDGSVTVHFMRSNSQPTLGADGGVDLDARVAKLPAPAAPPHD